MKIDVRNYIRSAGAVAALAVANSASAAIDIAAEVAAAKTDIVTAGTLIIGVVVVIASFAWLRRVIR